MSAPNIVQLILEKCKAERETEGKQGAPTLDEFLKFSEKWFQDVHVVEATATGTGYAFRLSDLSRCAWGGVDAAEDGRVLPGNAVQV